MQIKVCRHTIMSTLSNELFHVYYPCNEAKGIWDLMVLKYTTEDAWKLYIMEWIRGNWSTLVIEGICDFRLNFINFALF